MQLKNIRDRLRLLRKLNKLTQQTIADMLGVSQGFYAGIENGRYKPDTTLLSSFATIFNVTLDWLLTGEGPAYKDTFTIGKNITRLRQKKGWDQNHLASLLGVHGDHVKKLERGEGITVELFAHLCKVFNVNRSEFFSPVLYRKAAVSTETDQPKEETNEEPEILDDLMTKINQLTESEQKALLEHIDNMLLLKEIKKERGIK